MPHPEKEAAQSAKARGTEQVLYPILNSLLLPESECMQDQAFNQTLK